MWVLGRYSQGALFNPGPALYRVLKNNSLLAVQGQQAQLTIFMLISVGFLLWMALPLLHLLLPGLCVPQHGYTGSL